MATAGASAVVLGAARRWPPKPGDQGGPSKGVRSVLPSLDGKGRQARPASRRARPTSVTWPRFLVNPERQFSPREGD